MKLSPLPNALALFESKHKNATWFKGVAEYRTVEERPTIIVYYTDHKSLTDPMKVRKFAGVEVKWKRIA